MPSSFSLLLALLVVLVSQQQQVHSFPEEDEIVSLPLYGKPPTPQYSGYLDATEGCNTAVNGAFCKLHYWLALADNDWKTKPVVLWLNGGPGSSSVLGFLQELGPLLLNATGGLMENPYAWTQVANVFALESPIGVGFSYCEAQLKGGLCKNTDKYTASASRAALVDFFTNKFPAFQSHDFFITGESYAGIYVPTLAYEILSYNEQNPAVPIPLQGLAIGDPCTDTVAQKDSMDSLWYAHKYGLVDDAVFDVLWNKCNTRVPNFLMKSQQQQHTATFTRRLIAATSKDTECQLALRKFLLSSSRGLSQGWKSQYIDDYSLFSPVSFAEDNDMATYLNRADVKEALHVDDLGDGDWPNPAGDFDYTQEYAACNGPQPSDPRSMIDFYRKIVPLLNGQVWVYNGDTDPCVSYEGTRTAIKRVGFAEVDGGGYRPWFYNHTGTSASVLEEKPVLFGPDLLLQDAGIQFGGEIVNYEHGLAFLTFHGSGHMVPQFRPQAALHMLKRLVSYDSLSPLLPTNATLLAMTGHEFSDAMDKWTVYAKTLPSDP